jgi:hypothetical protein
MKHKILLLDKAFLSSIWPDLLVCVGQSIVILTFILAIWWLSDTFASFTLALQYKIRQIIYISIALTIVIDSGMFLIRSGLLFRGLGWIKYYLFVLPIDMASSLKEIRETIENESFNLVYLFLAIELAMLAFAFLVLYFIQGETWYSALRLSLVGVLPFPIALFVAFSSYIFVETALLILRSIIQRSRY